MAGWWKDKTDGSDDSNEGSEPVGSLFSNLPGAQRGGDNSSVDPVETSEGWSTHDAAEHFNVHPDSIRRRILGRTIKAKGGGSGTPYVIPTDEVERLKQEGLPKLQKESPE